MSEIHPLREWEFSRDPSFMRLGPDVGAHGYTAMRTKAKICRLAQTGQTIIEKYSKPFRPISELIYNTIF